MQSRVGGTLLAGGTTFGGTPLAVGTTRRQYSDESAPDERTTTQKTLVQVGASGWTGGIHTTEM